jgi:hypothetical protein
MLFSLLSSGQQINYFYRLNNHLQNISQEIEKVIPVEELKDNCRRIFSYCAAYNQYDKYWAFNPVVYYGWPVHFKPFRDKFGVLDINQLHQADVYGKFDYIILSRTPLGESEQIYDRFLNEYGIEILSSTREIIIVKVKKSILNHE